MKILIIGSGGFIGGHLLDFFNNLDYDVYGADVIDDSILKQGKYVLLDKQEPDFDKLFEALEFNLCINASGNGSVPISLTKPLFDFELNVTNTIKILNSIKKLNPNCKYINLSSAAVYGNPKYLPIKESSDLNPLSPYGWHKNYAEQICLEYFKLYGIQTISLRLFSVYGPKLRKQLLWDLYQKTLVSNDVELFGTGTETRDFIYINDLCNAINIVYDKASFDGGAINIASGVETSIKEIADEFLNLINPNITLRFNMSVKEGDPLNWKADVIKIENLGFRSKTKMRDGLNTVVKWLKENT